jgi:hypothetical protein
MQVSNTDERCMLLQHPTVATEMLGRHHVDMLYQVPPRQPLPSVPLSHPGQLLVQLTRPVPGGLELLTQGGQCALVTLRPCCPSCLSLLTSRHKGRLHTCVWQHRVSLARQVSSNGAPA